MVPAKHFVVAGRDAVKIEASILIGGGVLIKTEVLPPGRIRYEHSAHTDSGQAIRVGDVALETSATRTEGHVERRFHAAEDSKSILYGFRAAETHRFHEAIA